MDIWNINQVEENLRIAFEENSEVKLLEVLKNNSFLFYELYSRKYGIQPNFAEVPFGPEFRCDFLWLNDNSDGPEWVLVEIEKPKMQLFTKNGDPSALLNHAIEQVKSWNRYFNENPAEKKKLFGAVSRFRFILVGGSIDDWHTEHAIKWRKFHNEEYEIEIRSSDIFFRALAYAQNHYDDLWSFQDHPISLKSTDLKKYWQDYGYMDLFRRVL